jgi:hypothetical protein
MSLIDSAAQLTVLCARPPAAADADPVLRAVLDALSDERIHPVGPHPGAEIDPLLSGRLLVIGTDEDLAAVVARLDLRHLLGSVIVAYAPLGRTPLAELWSLPIGALSVRLARFGDPDLVPLLRSDTGEVLVGEATIGPVRGPVVLDGFRMLNGAARGVVIQPDRDEGVSVTVVPRRIGMFGRRPTSRLGAQVRVETAPATLVTDGYEHPEQVERCSYSRHPQPLRLVRGVVE